MWLLIEWNFLLEVHVDESRNKDIIGAVGRSTGSSGRERNQIFVAGHSVSGNVCDPVRSGDIYGEAETRNTKQRI